MKKYLVYMMRGESMCALHALMNALDLVEAGHEVKIILEGEAVKLPKIFDENKNPLYAKCKEKNLIVGVCKACSQVLGTLEYNRDAGMVLLDDMLGHAGFASYANEGYDIVVM
ncbi:MAG: hypothetical protein WC966_04810 [Bradymonadales bacterium]